MQHDSGTRKGEWGRHRRGWTSRGEVNHPSILAPTGCRIHLEADIPIRSIGGGGVGDQAEVAITRWVRENDA
jgi:hypothetical protein